MNNISSVVITLINPSLCEEVATKIDKISNCEVAAKENDKIQRSDDPDDGISLGKQRCKQIYGSSLLR